MASIMLSAVSRPTLAKTARMGHPRFVMGKEEHSAEKGGPPAEQATYTNSTIRFRHYDWLGSARFESNMSEQEYGDAAYAPFGETYSIKNTPYLSFTGQQQDTTSGLYDFLYREYNPVQGRWISPDPAGLAAVDPTNPQTWDRYGYVANSPLSFTDPLGLGIDAKGNCHEDDYTVCVTESVGGDVLFGQGPFNPCHEDVFRCQRKVPANNATIRPLSKLECASFVADKQYSIAAHTSGSSPDNPVVQALLGNSVSGLYDLWNAPSTSQGLKSLLVGGVNPGLPGPSWGGGLSGIVTDRAIKATMTNFTKAATDEAATIFGYVKLGYDAATFAYAFGHDCHN
jgi:RHS repeat-associated protein